jgi:hypothetical protein
MNPASWVQAGAAPGCACEHSVRAGRGITLARLPHGKKLRFGRDRRTSEETKGGWRLGRVAQGLAGPVEVDRLDWLRADNLRFIADSRNGSGRRVRPRSTARTRYGFRRALAPNASDSPAATIGANLHDVTEVLHPSDPTSASQKLRDRSLKKPVAIRAEHGSGPGRYRRIVHRASGSAIFALFVSAANIEATSPDTFVKTGILMHAIKGRLTGKLRRARNQRENTFRVSHCISMAAAVEGDAAAKETL